MEDLLNAAFRILREKGTELPGSGKLLHEKRKGMFVLVAKMFYFLLSPSLILVLAGRVLVMLPQRAELSSGKT